MERGVENDGCTVIGIRVRFTPAVCIFEWFDSRACGPPDSLSPPASAVFRRNDVNRAESGFAR
jgi:hypothetical protein